MTKEFNIRLIAKILGSLLVIEGFFFVLCMAVDLYYGENIWIYFLQSAGIALVLGFVGVLLGRKASPQIGKREGSVIVTMTWLLFSCVGMMPFVLSGSIPSVTDAFFETMSGFTTTGASVLNNIEELPHSILFWRSTTHWIGGLGIIVISMALLPVFGFSGMYIFSAEATGPTKDKIHPKISETAKRLLGIYVVLTLSETILLKVAGMSWFDAVCHSFATIATGGFSTRQSSIGAYNSPAIEYIVIFFMIFSGINFSLYYFLFKQKIAKVFHNEEFRVYLLIIGVFTVLLTLTHLYKLDFSFSSFEDTLRNSLFVVSSTISTTGFVTVDYGIWPTYTWIMVIVLMLIGSSAGSTAGGMKVVRVLLTFKYSYYEFKRLIHPNAVFPVRYNDHVMEDGVITRILSFVIVYIMLIVVGSLLLSFAGMDFVEALTGQITCLSNVGPGLGKIGPAFSFSELSVASKWILSASMMIGRLELFTVLVIFTPVFWKK
ncbi:MAG: Trk system uptake protein TrkH [Bacteroidetes bacterium]|nr:Trk system uptake protein TrkH [Bacteroidota bacterium]